MVDTKSTGEAAEPVWTVFMHNEGSTALKVCEAGDQDAMVAATPAGHAVFPGLEVQGIEQGVHFTHVFVSTADPTAHGDTFPAPLRPDFRGGALLIQTSDDQFVRAYGPSVWTRVTRNGNEEFIGKLRDRIDAAQDSDAEA